MVAAGIGLMVASILPLLVAEHTVVSGGGDIAIEFACGSILNPTDHSDVGPFADREQREQACSDALSPQWVPFGALLAAGAVLTGVGWKWKRG